MSPPSPRAAPDSWAPRDGTTAVHSSLHFSVFEIFFLKGRTKGGGKTCWLGMGAERRAGSRRGPRGSVGVDAALPPLPRMEQGPERLSAQPSPARPCQPVPSSSPTGRALSLTLQAQTGDVTGWSSHSQPSAAGVQTQVWASPDGTVSCWRQVVFARIPGGAVCASDP